MFLRSLTTEAMGICPSADGGSIRCPSADGQGECGLACGRQEQNYRNAQLVPIYRGQPANEQRRVSSIPFISVYL